MCRHAPLLALLLVVLQPAATWAAPFDFVEQGADPRAPVLLDGREVMRVGGVTSLPAQLRAAGIRSRLETLVADPHFDPDAVRLQETELGWRIQMGDTSLMLVTTADGHAEGVSPKVLAEAHRRAIIRAVERGHAERTPEARRTGLRQSLVATLLLLFLLLTEVWSSRRVDAWMARLVARKMERLQMDPFRRETADKMLHALRSLVHGAWVIVAGVALIYWAKYVLGRFHVTREVAFRAQRWLEPWFTRLGAAMLKAIPKLLVLGLIVWGTVLLLRWMTVLFRGLGSQTIRFHGFDPEWAAPTLKLLRMVLIVFAVVVAYPFIPGSETSAFKGISIFVGVVFSLSSTTAVTNIIAGYMLAYRRPFRPGDMVRIKEVLGEVMEVRLLVTKLRTPKNEEVVVPNSLILDGEVTNYTALSREGGLVMHAKVGIGYDVPWRQVEAMLLEAAANAPGFLADPPPYVLQRELGSFDVTYEVNARVTDPKNMERLQADLHRSIQDVFNRNGVQIMTPHYIADPPELKIVAPENWNPAPAKSGAAAAPPEESH